MNTNWRGRCTRALYTTVLHSSCLIWQKMWFWLSIAANQAISKPCDLEQQWLLWPSDSLGLGGTWLACSVPHGIKLDVSWNHGGRQVGWAGRSFTQQVFSFPHGLPHHMCCLFIQSFTLSLLIAWHLAPLESTNIVMTLPWKPTQHHFCHLRLRGRERDATPWWEERQDLLAKILQGGRRRYWHLWKQSAAGCLNDVSFLKLQRSLFQCTST